MSRPDLFLSMYQDQLSDLEENIKSLGERRRIEQSVTARNKLDLEIEQLSQEMTEIEQKIEALQVQTSEAAGDALVVILERFSHSLFDSMRLAYQQTLAHWTWPENRQAETAESLRVELSRIPQGSRAYSAQTEFVAHLIEVTSDSGLAIALRRWGDRHCPDINPV